MQMLWTSTAGNALLYVQVGHPYQKHQPSCWSAVGVYKKRRRECGEASAASFIAGDKMLGRRKKLQLSGHKTHAYDCCDNYSTLKQWGGRTGWEKESVVLCPQRRGWGGGWCKSWVHCMYWEGASKAFSGPGRTKYWAMYSIAYLVVFLLGLEFTMCFFILLSLRAELLRFGPKPHRGGESEGWEPPKVYPDFLSKHKKWLAFLATLEHSSDPSIFKGHGESWVEA